MLAALLAGCATAFSPVRVQVPAEIANLQSATHDGVTVSAGILDEQQARRHFGVDFARPGLQALWISVRNDTDRQLWFLRNRVDPDFYSAEEAARLVEAGVDRDSRALLHQHLRDESMRVLVAPRTITEGYLYLPLAVGGRYVDIRLQGDAYDEEEAGAAGGRPPRELRFGFALRLPDGDFDYERLDPARTYAGQDLPDLTLDQLRGRLQDLPCCAAGKDGEAGGDPLNIVLVGDSGDVLNALSRSGWSFTHRIDLRTIRREIGAAVGGTPYPVAPVSSLYLFGRKQDVAFQHARRTIAQRNHMRLWLAPFRCLGHEVWIGQVSRDIGVKLTTHSPTLTTHVIDPQVDATREYLLHSLLAQGLVARFGFVGGSAAAPAAAPRHNLTGDPYFSDGLRLVVLLAPEVVAPDEVHNLRWERSAPPIAEGQGEAAGRNVRPILPGAPR